MGRGGRQTLEIVGVLEEKREWNERVNLHRNRLASHPSLFVLQGNPQILHPCNFTQKKLIILVYTVTGAHSQSAHAKL